ncbi:MAG TPA: molybdenum ABC transporter permease [Mucilaginibacter sp.]|jgi:hypothetical protein
MITHHIHHTTLYIGIVFTIAGIILRMLINRRRFNRRGIAGLQLFSSYWHWWLTTRIENLLMIFALLFIVAGIWLILTGSYINF